MSTDDTHNLHQTLNLFLQALPPDSPPYCLIGALAVGTWGRVRATQDLDFLMMLTDETSARMVGILESFGFTFDTRWAHQNPIAKDRVIRLRHTIYPLDLIKPADPHETEVLARRTIIPIAQSSVWVATAEDLILLKLKASRDHDFEDARSIVRRQGSDLDPDYLWSWGTAWAFKEN